MKVDGPFITVSLLLVGMMVLVLALTLKVRTLQQEAGLEVRDLYEGLPEPGKFYGGSFESCSEGRHGIEIVLYDDIMDLAVEAWKRGSKADFPVGFTVVGADEVDVMHVPLPMASHDDRTITTWGHELLHVVCGDWHP